jgi:hypothetical protein
MATTIPGVSDISQLDPGATDAAETAAKNTYYNAIANHYSQSDALAAANQAFQNALSTAQLSGYFGAGVGNGTVAGQPTFPNLQYTANTFGQYTPGGLAGVTPYTQTQQALQNMQQYGLNQAGVTGVYYDPSQMTYAPGMFIRDPTTNAIGQIQSNGQLRMFGDQGDFLRAGGSWDMVNNPDMMRNVSTEEYQRLAQAPGQNANGPGGTASLQLQQMYGTYGMPTAGAPTMALQAMYGSNAAPTAGQQTLAAQNQYFNQAATEAGLTGWYNAPNATATSGANPTPGQGQQTLAAQGQYWNQNFQQAQANQSNTMAYLNLLSSLRGPADWAKYQQVLGSTPGGMRDLYAAAMGQYVPGGGATTGYQPQAANLNTLQEQVGGYTANPGQPQTPGQAWGSGIGIGGQQPTPAQQQQAQGGGANMYGSSMPAPNQISAQSWNNLAPSQQQMFLGMYENQGWDKNDVEALYKQSLPKYGTNSPTAGTWRMQ